MHAHARALVHMHAWMHMSEQDLDSSIGALKAVNAVKLALKRLQEVRLEVQMQHSIKQPPAHLAGVRVCARACVHVCMHAA